MGASVIEPELKALLGEIDDVDVVYDAEFGAMTTYRVGGSCAAMITAKSSAGLGKLLGLIAPRPIYVLGNGSNTLVADRGWDGVVLRLAEEFEQIEISNGLVRLGAAVSLPIAARRLAAAGVGGMEWAVGIPGTIGGAIKMNAGGHGSDTATWLETAELYRFSDGRYRLQDVTKDGLALRYRASNVGDLDVVTSATFALTSRESSELKQKINDIVGWRREHQPGGQNAGSVFVNPAQDYSARLIESIGMKGFRLGTAEVSSRHANFIQADPGGSGDDVFELIWMVQQRVEKELGIRLRTEIRLMGFDPERSRYLKGDLSDDSH